MAEGGDGAIVRNDGIFCGDVGSFEIWDLADTGRGSAAHLRRGRGTRERWHKASATWTRGDRGRILSAKNAERGGGPQCADFVRNDGDFLANPRCGHGATNPGALQEKAYPERPRAGRWGQRHRSKDRPLLLLTQRVASRSGCATVEARRVVCVGGGRVIGSQAAASGECAAVRRSRTRWVPSIVR